MSAHSQGSGPRSNAYSDSKCSNWTLYDPFMMEAHAALKRFDSRLSRSPVFPRIITIAPISGYIHACTRQQIQTRLSKVPAKEIQGLRAVFLLAGTRKQERSWYSNLGCYGIYMQSCIFLCSHPFRLDRFNLDSLRDFYIDDVLIHEVAHHMDRFRRADHKTREGFANAFVQQSS